MIAYRSRTTGALAALTQTTFEGFVLTGVEEPWSAEVTEEQFADWDPATPADALAAREYFASHEHSFEVLHCGACMSGAECEHRAEIWAQLEQVRAEIRALGEPRFVARRRERLSGGEFWMVADRVESYWATDGHLPLDFPGEPEALDYADRRNLQHRLLGLVQPGDVIEARPAPDAGAGQDAPQATRMTVTASPVLVGENLATVSTGSGETIVIATSVRVMSVA